MLPYLIIKTSRHLRNKLDIELGQINLTAAQFSVLNRIQISNNKVLASELAVQLGSDKPTISGIVKRLGQMSLIVKTPHETDRRAEYLSLTELGIDRLDEARQIADKVTEVIFSDFDNETMATFESYLVKLLTNLEG